jgi:hypothetical protein
MKSFDWHFLNGALMQHSKFESLFGKVFKPIKASMNTGYHSRIDDSPLSNEEDSAKYRSIIGSYIWITITGRFDIVYAISAIIRYNMLPRVRYLKGVKRILS